MNQVGEMRISEDGSSLASTLSATRLRDGVIAHARIGVLEGVLEIVDDIRLAGGVDQNVGGHGALGFIAGIAQHFTNLRQILVGQRRKHLLNGAGGAVRHQGMAMGEILGRGAAARGGLGGLQKPVVGAHDLLGQSHVSLRRIAQIEMRSAALFNADVQNGLAVIATHGFQMRFDHPRDLV